MNIRVGASLFVAIALGTVVSAEPAAAQTPLSDTELERLRTISKWDIEYTESNITSISGGGGSPPSASWLTGYSLSYQANFVFSFQLTVGRAGECTTPSGNLPCQLLMSAENPGELRIDRDDLVDRWEHNRRATDGTCWCNPPTEGTFSQELSLTSTGGVRVLDGTPGLPASAHFGIDTRVNPPRASGSTNVYAEFPGRKIVVYCTSCEFNGLPAGCTTSQDISLPGYPHGWTNFEFGAEEQEGWGLTNTPVQVEDGHFVIRAHGVFNRPGSKCLSGPVYCGQGYQNLPCSETRVEGTQTLYATLVIREHDAPTPIKIHSAEFTQGIQVLQPLELLKADLIGDGSPPIPIVAKKPIALRIYPGEVTSRTTATFEVSGQVIGSKTMTLEPHCTPELRRGMEQGCVSANFYFTPPVGDWTVTVRLKDQNGDILESHDLDLTSKESRALVLRAVSVCDAVDAAGNWLCEGAQSLAGIEGLLSKIIPTDEVRVEITGHQVKRKAMDYDADADGNLDRDESLAWIGALLNDILGLYQITDWYAERHYFYGMMRAAAPGFPGAAFTNGKSAASKAFATTLGTVNWTQYVVAHETAHMLGREHTSSAVPAVVGTTGCWGPGANPDGNWPYADNYLRSGPPPGVFQVGFDVESGSAVDQNSFEIAAYCSHGWISPYGYLKLLKALELPPAPASASTAASGTAGAYWLVAGTISGGTAALEPLFTRDLLGTTEPGTGTHRIEVLDGLGAVLYTRNFSPESIHVPPPPGEEIAEADPYFAELVPVQPGAASIIVMDAANAPLGSILLGGQAPTVTVTSPSGGATLGGPHSITWSVLDPDSASHTFEVNYSSDGGATWQSVGAGVADNLNVDFGTLPGTSTGTALVRVLASDGVNTGVGTSDGFTVSKKQPLATIVFPLADAGFARGALVLLQGTGFDPDDGLLAGSSLQWSSDIDGPLGSGNDLPVYELSPARHTITLSVMDADGNVATDQVVIILFDPPTADGDGDDDVDLIDFVRLKQCWAGPRTTPAEPVCLAFDFDVDGDLDAMDFAAFQNCVSGASTLADPQCAR